MQEHLPETRLQGKFVALSLTSAMVICVLSGTLAVAAVVPDGPGAVSHFDLARKDCLGTAQSGSSKVWFTIANGVLSDVYYPTNDNTNVETLQFVVTDGSTFADIQTRDTTYTVNLLDPRALDCRVITTAKSGKYRIITDYLTDTTNNTVVMDAKFQPLVGTLSSYQVYVIYNPTINGNGGGGTGNGGADSGTIDSSSGHNVLVASDPITATNAANRTYAVPVYSALDATPFFLQETNGFVGVGSDPLLQLQSSYALTTLYSDAINGNLVQGAQIDISKGGNFTLALGFGTGLGGALSAAESTLATSFTSLRKNYEDEWEVYDTGLKAPPPNLRGVGTPQWHTLVDEYYLSANLLKAAEDFPRRSAGRTDVSLGAGDFGG